MDKILGSKFLIANALTYEFSQNSSRELDYDFFSFHDDVAKTLRAEWASLGLDRRAIAVGSDFYLHTWDLVSGAVAGWKETVFICTGLYSQMSADIAKPTDVLMLTPDRNFDFAADMQRKGCNMTFVNNECLDIFERHVLTRPEFPWEGDYNVVDIEELENLDGAQFDFVHIHTVDTLINPPLLDKVIDLTRSGGVIYTAPSNENMRLYSDKYYIEPLFDFYEQIHERDDITSYHIPHALGFHILVKK
jgi:hypothetical protein